MQPHPPPRARKEALPRDAASSRVLQRAQRLHLRRAEVRVGEPRAQHCHLPLVDIVPAELGGYNVYEGQMAMLRAWLANPHFCPTQVEALRALQHA